MNLANMHETKEFKKQHKELSDTNIGMINNEVNGSKLVLTRLIGHREMEPTLAPKYTLKQIEKAKERIAEEQLELIKAGLITKSKDKKKTALTHELGVVGDWQKEQRNELRKKIPQVKRVYQEDPLIGINTKWSISDKCWNCSKYRYCVIFYQRSKADIWFNREPDLSSVPSHLLS